MLESATLFTFVLMLGASVVYRLPLLCALVLGWLLFFDYGLMRGHDMGELARMSAKGLGEVGPVLLLFALIGALTASWRAAGTIPAITCWSQRMASPSVIVPVTFLLCCAMSVLTGSSFAASATTGVICMSIASSMGANLLLVGGAIISGSFVGDQLSPMSSSAALVAGITETDLFDNVGRMVRTSAVPLAASLLLYAALGSFGAPVSSDVAAATSVTQALRSFDLSPLVLAPVVLVFALCLLRVDVRLTMVASLAVASLLCVTVQGMDAGELLRTLVAGYHAAGPETARLVDGGGILSMAEIGSIVAVASTYAGLFEGTGLLEGMGQLVARLSQRTTPYLGVLLTSAVTAAIACDQVVAIMLVRQLCDRCEGARKALALDMESSVTLLPALIPWSTSCVGIVAFTGMPLASVVCAFYPLLVVVWIMALSLWQHAHPAFVDGRAARLLGLTAEDDLRRLAA